MVDPVHVWYIFTYIYLYLPTIHVGKYNKKTMPGYCCGLVGLSLQSAYLLADFYGFHVGKYTVRPMNPMGQKTDWFPLKHHKHTFIIIIKSP